MDRQPVLIDKFFSADFAFGIANLCVSALDMNAQLAFQVVNCVAYRAWESGIEIDQPAAAGSKIVLNLRQFLDVTISHVIFAIADGFELPGIRI